MSKKIYVGNLNYTTTESTLRDLFEELGTVLAVNLITDRDTGRSKGFGFVEMEDDSAAQKAISQLDGQIVDQRPIKVAEARPQQSREFRSDRGDQRRRRY